MSLTTPWTIIESDFPATYPMADRIRFLIRYALLAPSSHNTQPWQFRIADDRVDVFMDEGRWLKVADKDQRELHISIGCALENLLIAAKHFGLVHSTDYLPDPANPMHAAGGSKARLQPPWRSRRPTRLMGVFSRVRQRTPNWESSGKPGFATGFLSWRPREASSYPREILESRRRGLFRRCVT